MHKVIISGGGTGGHIFPAVAIANEIKRRYPECKILFVGAIGKMEMEKVPQAGFEIIGLPIAGIQRKLTFSNLWVPIKFLKSIWKARKILKEFRPDKVVGVGGFASSALLYSASGSRIPILIQEQNSYAGLTNKWLAGKADKICVAYEGMETFFPAEKLVLTGNPVRAEIYSALHGDRREAKRKLNFNPDLPLVLVVGGSLGAQSINRGMQAILSDLAAENIQVLWQTGKFYNAENQENKGIQTMQFINDMNTAYMAADIVVSRAGALSVSELSLLHKACILIPSPNVAEDHQTKNAKALSDKHAAVLLKDADIKSGLLRSISELVKNKEKQDELSKRIAEFARPNAIRDIVDTLEKIGK